jgi:leucyl-tRNA synthetase
MKALILLLSPFAPHICEEMWANLGFEGLVCTQAWPEYDESKTLASVVQIAVQVSGKVRASISISAEADDDTVVVAALADSKIQKYADGMDLIKKIVVRDKKRQLKLVNLIFKPSK